MLESNKQGLAPLGDSNFSGERAYFHRILESFIALNWISTYKIETAPRLPTLRHLLGGHCPKFHSRSHKRIQDDFWFGLQIKSTNETENVGVDFENASPDNYDWNRFDQVRVQMGLLPNTSPTELLTHWSARQAIFKSSSNFRDTSDSATSSHYFEILSNKPEQILGLQATQMIFRHQDAEFCQNYQAYSFWYNDWVLSIAKPISTRANL